MKIIRFEKTHYEAKIQYQVHQDCFYAYSEKSYDQYRILCPRNLVFLDLSYCRSGTNEVMKGIYLLLYHSHF